MVKTKGKKKISKKAVALIVAAACCIGGIGAYALSAGLSNNVDNNVHIGGDGGGIDGANSIDIEEPDWIEPTEDDPLEGGVPYTQDPLVRSNVLYNGYVMMRVAVQKINADGSDQPVVTLGLSGAEKSDGTYEDDNIGTADLPVSNFSDGWKVVTDPKDPSKALREEGTLAVADGSPVSVYFYYMVRTKELPKVTYTIKREGRKRTRVYQDVKDRPRTKSAFDIITPLSFFESSSASGDKISAKTDILGAIVMKTNDASATPVPDSKLSNNTTWALYHALSGADGVNADNQKTAATVTSGQVTSQPAA